MQRLLPEWRQLHREPREPAYVPVSWRLSGRSVPVQWVFMPSSQNQTCHFIAVKNVTMWPGHGGHCMFIPHSLKRGIFKHTVICDSLGIDVNKCCRRRHFSCPPAGHCEGFCSNGGTCMETSNGTKQCRCPSKYLGPTCSLDKCMYCGQGKCVPNSSDGVTCR